MSAVVLRRCVVFHPLTIQQGNTVRTPPVAVKFALQPSSARQAAASNASSSGDRIRLPFWLRLTTRARALGGVPTRSFLCAANVLESSLQAVPGCQHGKA